MPTQDIVDNMKEKHVQSRVEEPIYVEQYASIMDKIDANVVEKIKELHSMQTKTKNANPFE